MVHDMGTRRLAKELAGLKKDPLTNPRIAVAPNESNIHELHYVIEGSSGTPYEGGIYHGKLLFPKEYPLKPPSVIMLTPSGRFVPNRRLCLSMSDFHPESWNPMWSIGTILTGLYSFMIEKAPTLGSIETSDAQKQKFAKVSLEYNVKDPNFGKLFPEYLQLHQERLAERAKQLQATSDAANQASLSASRPLITSDAGELRHAFLAHRHNHNNMPFLEMQGILAAAAGVVAVISIFFAMRFL